MLVLTGGGWRSIRPTRHGIPNREKKLCSPSVMFVQTTLEEEFYVPYS